MQEIIEVVIKIPKRTYDRVSEKGVIAFGDDAYYIGHAIANGTVLPKGHGDLKDIAEIERLWQKGDYDSLTSAVIFAPTVIEADKAGDTDGRN